jgi:hypothetical protein
VVYKDGDRSGDPAQKKLYIQDVLTNGLSSDVSKLDLDEIKRLLPHLSLDDGLAFRETT